MAYGNGGYAFTGDAKAGKDADPLERAKKRSRFDNGVFDLKAAPHGNMSGRRSLAATLGSSGGRRRKRG